MRLGINMPVVQTIENGFHRFRGQNLYVTLHWSAETGAPDAKTIATALASTFKVCDLRRLDSSETDTRASFHVQAHSSDQIFAALERFKTEYPKFDIAIVEHHRVPGA